MPLQISAFSGEMLLDANLRPVQVPSGPPIDVTTEAFTGEYTVPPTARLVKIIGSGKVTWPGQANAELINGAEFRGVKPGSKFTVA